MRENYIRFLATQVITVMARGAGPYDDNVAYMRLFNCIVEAKTVGDLLVTGIPKHNLASADHHGYLARVDTKSVQQVLYGRIVVEVYVGVRVPVARQKLFDPKSTYGMN
jgi:hypothetical protein